MKVRVVCRKIYDYVRYDLKEIAFPSSLPDPPHIKKRRKLTWEQRLWVLKRAAKLYAASWVRDIGPDLRPEYYKKDELTEEPNGKKKTTKEKEPSTLEDLGTYTKQQWWLSGNPGASSIAPPVFESVLLHNLMDFWSSSGIQYARTHVLDRPELSCGSTNRFIRAKPVGPRFGDVRAGLTAYAFRYMDQTRHRSGFRPNRSDRPSGPVLITLVPQSLLAK